MEKQYGSVAEFYDALNADFDYQAYASYIVGRIKANEKINSSLVLDLACGTGKMTFLLREHGYEYRGNILVLCEPYHDPRRQAFDKIL